MGQLLIVSGRDAEKVNRLLGTAVRLFNFICGLKPCDQLSGGSIAVAKFPRLVATTPGIVRDESSSAWISGAGSYFYPNMCGEDCVASDLRTVQAADGTASGSGLSDLNGIFEIAFYHGLSGDLLLITDRLGSLHIYKAVVDSCLVLSTSSMAIAALLRPHWDLVSCREFLAIGTIFEQRTPFEGIEKRFSNSKAARNIRPPSTGTWRLCCTDQSPVKGDVPSLAGALEDACSLLSRHFKKPAMDLTGGLDSRAFPAAVLKAGVDFDTVVNGSESDPDVVTSKRIALEVGLRHRHQVPRVN